MALRSENLAAPPSNRLRLHMMAAAYGLLLLLLYASEIQGAAIRKAAGGPPTTPAHPNEVGGQQVDGGLRRPEEMGTRPLRRVARDLSDEEYDEDYWNSSDEGEDEATSVAPEDSPNTKDPAEGSEEETSAGNTEEGEEEEASEGSEGKVDTEDAASATAGDDDASVETGSAEGGTAKEEDDDDWLNYNWSNESGEEGGEGHSWESITEKHDEDGAGDNASFKGAAEGSAEGEENVKTEESEDDAGDDDDPIANEISTEKWKSKSEVNGKASSHETEESSYEDVEENSGVSEGTYSEPEHETEQETEADSDPELVAIVPANSSGQAHNDTEETKESGEEAGSGTMEGVGEDWEGDKDEAAEAEEDDGEKAEDEDVGDKGLDKSGEENESWEEDEEASWEAGHGTAVDTGMVAGGKRCKEGVGKEVGEEGGEDEWSEEDCQNTLAKGKALGTEEVEGMGVGGEGSGEPPDEGIVKEGSLEDQSEEWDDEDEEGSGEEEKTEGIGVNLSDGDEDKGKDSVEDGEEHDGEHAEGHEGKGDEDHSGKHDGGVVIGEHDEEKEDERESEELGVEEGRSITTESEEEGEEPEGSGGGEGDDHGSGEGGIKGSQLDVGIKGEGSGSIEEEGGEGETDDSESEEEVTEPVPAVVRVVHQEHQSPPFHSGAEETGGEEGEESETEETDDNGPHLGVDEKGAEEGPHSGEEDTTEENEVTVVHGSVSGEGGEDEGLHSGEADTEEGSVTDPPGESEADDDDEWPESEEEEADHRVPYSGVDEVGNGAEEGEGAIANISSNVYEGIDGEAQPESTTTEEEGDVAVVHVPHSADGGEEEDESRPKAGEESGMSSGVQPGEGGEKDEDEWPESEEDRKDVHGPHSEGSEKEEEAPHTDGVEEEDAGATEVISAEAGQGEDEDDVSDSEDKWYLRSEYDDLDFGDEDETVTPRKKTESEEDPFGLKMIPGLIANISGNVYKGILGEAKPGSTTTQKVPPNTSEGRKTQNAVENQGKAGISVRKMKVVADLGAAPFPANAEGGNPETPVQGEASSEKGDDGSGGDDKVSDTLITWVALGVVAAVFFGVLGYVYVRGKKTSGKGV
ncbi:protein starmaker-like, partial [Hetaerina americana]